VAEIAIIKASGTNRARERSEIERRRKFVARRRWLEATETGIRPVERDFIAIRNDARRYLSAANFDARFEVGEALARADRAGRFSN
jgi:hypothetical protein